MVARPYFPSRMLWLLASWFITIGKLRINGNLQMSFFFIMALGKSLHFTHSWQVWKLIGNILEEFHLGRKKLQYISGWWGCRESWFGRGGGGGEAAQLCHDWVAAYRFDHLGNFTVNYLDIQSRRAVTRDKVLIKGLERVLCWQKCTTHHRICVYTTKA